MNRIKLSIYCKVSIEVPHYGIIIKLNEPLERLKHPLPLNKCAHICLRSICEKNFIVKTHVINSAALL